MKKNVKKKKNDIPEEIMEKARTNIKKYGASKAWHYASYNVNWTTGPSNEDRLYWKALLRLEKDGFK